MVFDCGSRRISRGRLYMIVFCGREDFQRVPVLFFIVVRGDFKKAPI